MANIIEFDTYNVCSAYVCALEYGDYTGLESGEDKQVNDFLDTLPASAMFDWIGESYFARDEISGLMADCIECRVFYDADSQP